MKNIIKSNFFLPGIFVLVTLNIIVLNQCQPNKGHAAESTIFNIAVKNSSEIDRRDYLASLDAHDFPMQDEETIDLQNLSIFYGQDEVPCQVHQDKILFLVDELKAGKEKIYSVSKGKPESDFPKRTQAEISVKTGGKFEDRKYIGGQFQNIEYLRVPDEHTDHSFYIRYEGPGWESDLVGYRFYLDWRNATDVFGKTTDEMVLQGVGLDGFDSYHEMQDWGMDVLKVGKSLGMGSLAIFDDDHAVRVDKTDSITCEIVDNGNIYSSINTKYFGWKVGEAVYDVDSKISIHAGTRLTHHEIEISSTPDNLSTGVGKDGNAKLYTDQGGDDRFGYLASFGLQSLNEDHLGMAIFFANKDYKGFTEDEFSHVVKLEVTDEKVDYYFLAIWEKDKSGINSEVQFMDYIQNIAYELANPLEVSFKQ